MTKAVAIPYVIALVLGVVIIGLLAYWFITQSGETTETGSKIECDSKIASYCIQYKTLRREPTDFNWGDCPHDNINCEALGISIS